MERLCLRVNRGRRHAAWRCGGPKEFFIDSTYGLLQTVGTTRPLRAMPSDLRSGVWRRVRPLRAAPLRAAPARRRLEAAGCAPHTTPIGGVRQVPVEQGLSGMA